MLNITAGLYLTETNKKKKIVYTFPPFLIHSFLCLFWQEHALLIEALIKFSGILLFPLKLHSPPFPFPLFQGISTLPPHTETGPGLSEAKE